MQDFSRGGGVQKDFLGGGGGYKNLKRRLKNLCMFTFVTFLRVKQTFRVGGFKTSTSPLDRPLTRVSVAENHRIAQSSHKGGLLSHYRLSK